MRCPGVRQSTVSIVRHVLLIASIGGFALPSFAQAPTTGSIEGSVSTQDGSVRLPGVVVRIRDDGDHEIGQQASDGEGLFRFLDLPPASYHLTASLDGFQTAEGLAVVVAGGVTKLVLDLPIAAITESVDVVAHSPVSSVGTLATTETVNNKETQLLAPGEGFQSAVRLLADVIEVPGGQSIDGGRPNQASLQIGAATLIDPATNLARLSLPADGIDSVSVLQNPYEVEFGRFASGLVELQTKSAVDHWRFRLNDVEPAFRLKRYTLLDIKGIAALKPSVEFGGPLVKHRVLLEQTAQYHYTATDVPSRPESELRTSEWLSAFTRIDANLSPQQSIVLTGGFVPTTARHTTLGTFTPPAATADITDNVGHGAVMERSIWGGAVVESTVQFHEYQTTVHGQGSAPMEWLPDTTLGNFFNTQRRNTSTYQWIETASGSRQAPGGLHVFKVGLDFLHNGFEGTSASRPILIERSDGTLARRLDFGEPTVQSVHSNDIAVFAQDRLQPMMRWYVEFGGRLDRDGIIGRVNATPRAGMAVLLNHTATAVLHGGFGLFYERTPSIAGAFEQFETATDTRFAVDGVTALGPGIQYQHVTALDLEPARSTAWDVTYDHHFGRTVALHVGVLDRQGRDELIVNPSVSDRGAEILLSSTGRSSYLQEGVSVHVTHGSRMDVNASYVHSSAREDLNALIGFFDSVRVPILGVNAYAPAVADVPHRLLIRGLTMPTARWLLLGTLDWRSGLPYSLVNEALDFIGSRNAQRLPAYFRVDLGFERRLVIYKWQPWLGLRAANALDAFLPADVYANTGSAAFGSFANSEYRAFRIHLRFER